MIRVLFILQAARADSGAFVTSQYYKPIASVDQSDLEFIIRGDAENYLDLDIHMSVRGKLVVQDGTALDPKDSTAVVNNLLHSLFSQ